MDIVKEVRGYLVKACNEDGYQFLFGANCYPDDPNQEFWSFGWRSEFHPFDSKRLAEEATSLIKERSEIVSATVVYLEMMIAETAREMERIIPNPRIVILSLDGEVSLIGPVPEGSNIDPIHSGIGRNGLRPFLPECDLSYLVRNCSRRSACRVTTATFVVTTVP